MAQRSVNFFKGTLQQSIAAGATVCFIEPEVQALLPALGGGDVVKAVLYDQSQEPEIVEITAHAAGELTITRARESTAAVAWPAGTIITHDLTAELIEAIVVAGAVSQFIGIASGADSITLTLGGASPIPTPNDGDELVFSVAVTNTTATEITVTNGSLSVGPIDLVHQDGTALDPGDLAAMWPVTVRYSDDLSAWVLMTHGSLHKEADQINDGPLVPANMLPNGAFRAWNAGVTFVDPASGTTVADEYTVSYDGTIGNFTVSRQTFAPGQTDVPGNPDYFLRWAHTAAGVGSTFRRLRTQVAHVGRLSSSKVVRSIYMKADSARSVTGKLIQHFGTGGAPSADVEAESVVFNLTTAWQRFELPDTLPSIGGKTLGTNEDDALILSLDLPINTTMVIEFAMDQFEFGRATVPGTVWPLDSYHGGTGFSGSADELIDYLYVVLAPEIAAAQPDLTAIEALGGTGLLARTADSVWAMRSLAVGGGLTVANPAGTAGNPTVGLDTILTNYVADPLSVAELASVTGVFGTAAFVADSALVHIAGVETITGNKNFRGAVDAALVTCENTTTTHEMEERFASAGTVYEKTPAPSGTPDATKGLGYDFTNSRWFVDTALLVSGVILVSASAPGIGSNADTDTGFEFAGSDQIFCYNAAVRTWLFGQNIVSQNGGLMRSGGGSAAGPSFAFANATTSGLFNSAGNPSVAVSGTLVASATASGWTDAAGALWQVGGKHMIPLPASAWRAQTTNGAAYHLSELATNDQMVEGWAFDQTTQEHIQCWIPMPKSWNEGTITARFRWFAPSGSGNARWGIQALAVSDDDALDAAWGTAGEVTDTLTATGDLMVTAETSAITVAGTPAEGDMLLLRVYRDTGDGADTFNADAILIAVDLFVSIAQANDV